MGGGRHGLIATRLSQPELICDDSASYSSDGRWIVYAGGGAGGNADLYLMRADGTGSHALMRTSAWDGAPDWGQGT